MKKFDTMNVIPFIDIMLVLLAIVLMSATFVAQGKITVNSPTSSTTSTVQADDIKNHKLITIQADSQIHLDDEAITFEALTEKILTWEAEQTVNLKIDAQAPFSDFVKIGDLLRKQKITKINILALPEKP